MSLKRPMSKHISLFLTILCVIFIYCNSLMNADISSAQSSFVLDLFRKVAKMTGISPTLITERTVRKLAHFCEYALLGFLVTITTRLWYGELKTHIFMMLFWGLLIPVSDEFLQLFVAGRTGLVQDIILDFAGAIAGAVSYIGLSALSRYYKGLLYGKR